ncbi:putative signal peptide protein [Puccinia sorghi]|uniref:Putative signal peptide protein n=1 Tax=Puccinia sorghi TaxID=27349 RepID=A0A0L6UPR2_9BASI|nr:putative signal peptide protein [Puccinia sorghi]
MWASPIKLISFSKLDILAYLLHNLCTCTDCCGGIFGKKTLFLCYGALNNDHQAVKKMTTQ